MKNSVWRRLRRATRQNTLTTKCIKHVLRQTQGTKNVFSTFGQNLKNNTDLSTIWFQWTRSSYWNGFQESCPKNLEKCSSLWEKHKHAKYYFFDFLTLFYHGESGHLVQRKSPHFGFKPCSTSPEFHVEFLTFFTLWRIWWRNSACVAFISIGVRPHHIS